MKKSPVQKIKRRKSKPLDYVKIKEILFSYGGYSSSYPSFPDPCKIKADLKSLFGSSQIDSFISALENLFSINKNLPKYEVYQGFVDVAKGSTGSKRVVFNANNPTRRRIQKIKKDLLWFKGHFKPEQTFICDNPVISVDSLEALNIVSIIVEHHLAYLENRKRNKRRGKAPDTFFNRRVLILVLDLVVDGKMKPDDAYSTIIDLVGRLTGEALPSTKANAYRALATSAAKDVLAIKPIKAFRRKR